MPRKRVQTIDVYETMYRYYLKHKKFASSRTLSVVFKVSQISILKHRKNIEKLWRATRIWINKRIIQRKFNRELSGGGNDIYVEKIDTLQNRVNELEETLGYLMKKNWMLKIYKGTKLIYAVK